MTHYVVVQLAVKDQAALDAYYKVGGAAVAKHGGAPLAGGGKTVIEDNGGGTPAHVVLSFPDEASVRAWYDDPALVEVHNLRRKGAATTITLLPPFPS